MDPRPPVPLEQLLAPMRQAGLVVSAEGDLQASISSLAHDSRQVRPGGCFFAIRGEQADGHDFLDRAVQQGASAAFVEREIDPMPAALKASVLVANARAALAEAAATYFGRPSDRLALIGITGTNGKTTTAFLLHDALQALGRTAGLIGTVEVRIGSRRFDTTHTTPDALAVQTLLAEMVEDGCSACSMEVSSHALEQERVRATRFAAAIFTNLTHDHLDYHGSIEAYTEAKAKLFANLGADASAIVNADDPAWPFMVKDTAARVVTYGKEPPAAETSARDRHHVAYRIEENRIDGLRLTIDGASRAFRLAGAFNAANLAAAYATLRVMGYEQNESLDALAAAAPVPGRLETMHPQDAPGPIAVVDYAHTPDALANVLRTVREMVPAGGKLSVVFGCGGDRDRVKRPVMGRLAAELADRVILTNDNPRTEDPNIIISEIAEGMSHPPDAVLPDRALAIRTAVTEAASEDVVVVAGKGHETYQIVGTERHPFDDREIVLEAFQKRQPGPSAP